MPPIMRGPRRVGFLLALAGLGLAGGLAGCGSRAAQAPEPPLVRIAVAAPAAGTEAGYTGVVRARYESDLGFRAAGKVSARLVNPGDTVRQGQVLARLDPADLRLGAAAAQAQVAAAEKSAAAARAEAVRAQADAARFQALNAKGFASGQRYEQTRAAAEAAEANLAAALAQVRAAQAQAGQAGNLASYAALVADADGVVMSVLAEPGQVVAAGQPVIRLARAGAREAVIAVPETARARVPQAATAVLYGQEGRAIPATLRELSAAADPITRTYEARYVLAVDSAAAPLGATVTVRMGGEGDPGAAKGGAGNGEVSVPVSALYDSGSGPGVWVLDGRTSQVAYRRVTVKALGEERAVLTGGLRSGERIVALGVHLLRPGQSVRALGALAGAPTGTPVGAPVGVGGR